jgi:hypothetical protein
MFPMFSHSARTSRDLMAKAPEAEPFLGRLSRFIDDGKISGE